MSAAASPALRPLPLSEQDATPARPLGLDALAPGAVALVREVEPGSALGERLLDLGFVPGSRVRVLRRAPLGDPVEYELRGTRLCLRRAEAARIRVTPVELPGP